MKRRTAAAVLLAAVLCFIRRLDFVLKTCSSISPEPTAAEPFQPVIDAGSFEAPSLCRFVGQESAAGEVSFLYYFSWADEIHPQWLLDRPYAAFRRLLYGSVQDIEYVRVTADRASRRVTRLEFESPKVGRILVGHIYRRLEGAEIPLSGGRPVLQVASWNHLFEPGVPGSNKSVVPVVPLDPSLCRSLSIPWRSHPPGVELSH